MRTAALIRFVFQYDASFSGKVSIVSQRIYDRSGNCQFMHEIAKISLLQPKDRSGPPDFSAASDAVCNDQLETLHDWIQANPDSITARVALANTLVAYGWKARSTGYANSVTDSACKLLGERLTAAVQV
jgi:Domain of unknown function (DUF4034)